MMDDGARRGVYSHEVGEVMSHKLCTPKRSRSAVLGTPPWYECLAPA